MNIADSLDKVIGNTPMLELKKIEKSENIDAHIYAKLEFLNPGGSTKDRAALSMINGAEKEGKLHPGSIIVEPTSGNTGIGLAMISASRGYHCIIVMPDTMSVERRKVMTALGAELVLTDGSKGMTESIAVAKKIVEDNPGSMMMAQFENPYNPLAHYETTGPEIFDQTDGEAEILVAGIGTGGTISGCSRFLKEKIPGFKTIGYEPASSPLFTKGFTGPHKIQGIGPNYAPKNVDLSLIDSILDITNEEAFEYGRKLASEEGILAGISSGGAVAAAVKYAKTEEGKGKKIVVILTDTGNRYLSGEYYL